MNEAYMHNLKGGNFDLDMCSGDSINWKQDPYPWNVTENTSDHKCAVKNTSICRFFAGLGDGENIDTVLCT